MAKWNDSTFEAELVKTDAALLPEYRRIRDAAADVGFILTWSGDNVTLGGRQIRWQDSGPSELNPIVASIHVDGRLWFSFDRVKSMTNTTPIPDRLRAYAAHVLKLELGGGAEQPEVHGWSGRVDAVIEWIEYAAWLLNRYGISK